MEQKEHRKCSKCLEIKELSEFTKNPTTKHGRCYNCKTCSRLQAKESYQRHRESRKAKVKEYRKNNPTLSEKRKVYIKEYAEKNKEVLREKAKIRRHQNLEEFNRKQREYKSKNREKILSNAREYKKKNKDRISRRRKELRDQNPEHNKKHSKYILNKMKEDVNFKIACGLRNRMHKALIYECKTGSAVRDLGCSISDFKVYMENKFQEGMTWENWSKYGWHIDHIKPLASFNLSDPEEFKKAAHYTNLQPLWAKDNLSKDKFKNKKEN